MPDMIQPQQKKKTSWITLAVLLLLVAGFLLLSERETLADIYHDIRPEPKQEPLPVALTLDDLTHSSSGTELQESSKTEPASNTNAQTQEEKAQPLPDEFLLDVPFTTQAPHANWELPYQEACEEASAITVHYFYEQKTFTPDIADKEILDFVDFENKTIGDYKDTTAEETADLIKRYWGYNKVDVIEDPTIDDIKRHVFAGRPVIVPAAGKLLENPNFRNGGPLYHMFVVTGWDSDQFITNDVGTRNGENFRYSYENLMTSMHNWNGGDVENGAKRIVVLYPN